MENNVVTRLAIPSGDRPAINLCEVAMVKLETSAIRQMAMHQVDIKEKTWMTPIIEYIETEALPKDKVQARWLWLRAVRYVIIDSRLYKRSFSLPLLKCVTPEQGMTILKDIHKGVCENHTRGQSLIYKMIRQSYLWLTLWKDVIKYAKSCHKCQVFAPMIKRAQEELASICSPRPFAK